MPAQKPRMAPEIKSRRLKIKYVRRSIMIIVNSGRAPEHRTKIALFASALLFIGLCVSPASLWAQEQQVILHARELPVRTVLGEIDKQTDYNVVVNWDLLDPDKWVLFPASRLPVREILDRALADSNCTWEIDGNLIAIVLRQGEEQVYSTMHRSSLPAHLKEVVDPHSNRRLTAEELKRVRNGYWQYETTRGMDTMSLAVVNFRVNSTKLERDFMNNAATLDMIRKTFSNRELLAAMEFITITAAASPEGNTAANERLAEGRAKAVKSYIMWKYPFMDRDRIFTFSIGEDWSGLRKMVYDDLDTPNRQKVLDILDRETNGDVKRSQLKRLGGGAWRYIVYNMMPKLRGAAACMIHFREEPEPQVIVDTVFVERVTEIEKIVEIERIVEVEQAPIIIKERGPYYWAVKTNLLYDAILLPDLALEVSIGRKWSVEFGGQWSWWNSPYNHHHAWRIQIAGIEGRRWLGDRNLKTPLSGHYLGAYGMAGTYDVRLGGNTGYLSNMSYSVGISYGYSLPIARSWNIEFGLAVGYVGGKYQTYSIYNEQDNIFYRDGRFRKNYFGPTKAEISIVWLPGGKNPGKK